MVGIIDVECLPADRVAPDQHVDRFGAARRQRGQVGDGDAAAGARQPADRQRPRRLPPNRDRAAAGPADRGRLPVALHPRRVGGSTREHRIAHPRVEDRGQRRPVQRQREADLVARRQVERHPARIGIRGKRRDALASRRRGCRGEQQQGER